MPLQKEISASRLAKACTTFQRLTVSKWCKRLVVSLHHMGYYLFMAVVQKDSIISGMLEDERERSAAAVSALAQKAAEYPKGSIHYRKVRSKGKEYSYPFLKFREDGKSVFKHIPPPEVESVLNLIQKRKKIEEEIKKAEQRIRYLDRLISSGRPRKKGK